MIALAHLLILLACAAVAFYVCEPEELPPRRRGGHRWGAYLVAMLLAPDAWAGPDPGKVLPPPENCAPYPEWTKTERYRCALGYFDRACSLGGRVGCDEAAVLRTMRPEDLPDMPDPLLRLQEPPPPWWRWWPVPVGVLIAWIWARVEQARARRRR